MMKSIFQPSPTSAAPLITCSTLFWTREEMAWGKKPTNHPGSKEALFNLFHYVEMDAKRDRMLFVYSVPYAGCTRLVRVRFIISPDPAVDVKIDLFNCELWQPLIVEDATRRLAEYLDA